MGKSLWTPDDHIRKKLCSPSAVTRSSTLLGRLSNRFVSMAVEILFIQLQMLCEEVCSPVHPKGVQWEIGLGY